MPIVRAFTLIRLVTVAHIILGYYLIARPQKLAEINSIAIIGDAVGLQQPTSHLWQNPLGAGFAGLALILLAVSDFVAVSSTEELARHYWGAQGPVRCLFFGSLTSYIYFMKPGRDKMYDQTTPQPIINSIIFSWAFFETVYWFWIYTNLREELAEARARITQRKKMQDEIATL
ncbi:hypothetical protein EX30DRAFT_337796 [Ascodesmis nigricans]|uniref:Increased loss of mitochondrial DNA protein 1 n=1 Tax=Ascodesmis nigricans TaxID=341454 RepID=A0A4S2N882_9PEZI|nr:hypothetical protein EX30DRAFT_337796 [Ascodesmis nigricans]